MSSSFRLKKRREAGAAYEFGALEDHYIRPANECRPDFTAHPIGHPDGVKVCVRTVRERPRGPPRPNPAVTQNRYYKFASRLYEPAAPLPAQLYNPDRYGDRREPGQSYNLARDYLHPEIKFDGTGVFPTRTPRNKGLAPHGGPPFYEFGVSEIPGEPAPFNVARLHQLRPLWDRAKAVHAQRRAMQN
uniref:Uncharacterized protein n=1 Tax=Marseillevirus LCMAC103 TaxID=2506604 RepID=A0A481YVS7_9VIRU|nr:MAG: uncharacterized protein LCMAC103_03510 [Marseillevirus LCMAC103]